MSALPSKADIQWRTWDVRYGSKADVTPLNFDVRFIPESGHPSAQSKCLLWAINGLMHRSEQNVTRSPRQQGQGALPELRYRASLPF